MVGSVGTLKSSRFKRYEGLRALSKMSNEEGATYVTGFQLSIPPCIGTPKIHTYGKWMAHSRGKRWCKMYCHIPMPTTTTAAVAYGGQDMVVSFLFLTLVCSCGESYDGDIAREGRWASFLFVLQSFYRSVLYQKGRLPCLESWGQCNLLDAILLTR